MKMVNKKIFFALGLVFVGVGYVRGMESFNNSLIREKTFYIVGEFFNKQCVRVMKDCVHNYFIFIFDEKRITVKNNTFKLYQKNNADINLRKNHKDVSFINYLIKDYFENKDLLKNALSNENNYGVFIAIKRIPPTSDSVEPIDQITITEYLKG